MQQPEPLPLQITPQPETIFIIGTLVMEPPVLKWLQQKPIPIRGLTGFA